METTLLTQPGEARIAFDRRTLALSGLVGLLLAEVVVLTLRFDSQALVDGGLPLVGYARYLPQALMAVAAAALVFGGARGGGSGRRGSRGRDRVEAGSALGVPGRAPVGLRRRWWC